MTFVFTIVELFTGTANVDVASAVQVTSADLFPEYVALALAALLSFVAVVPLGRPAHGNGGPFGLGTR